MSIDLAFRPDSYSDFDDPVALALNGINGQMRRVMVRDMMTAEGETRDHYDDTLGPIDPALLDEQSDEDRVRFRNSTLGPSWLGGEYLPRRKSQEVEIARVVLNSVLMDVFSLRARWSGGRYHYRLVDEYDSNITICRKTSRRTLTLRQVIEVLDSAAGDLSTEGAGIPEAFWDQQWEYGDRPEACTAFAWVESEVYPELPDWYDQRAEAWRAEREAETADGVEDVDVEEDESRFDADAPVGVVTLAEPWGSTFQVSLTRPDGWRWVNGSEWRRDEEDLDPDLLALVRPSGADLDHPSLLLSKSPPVSRERRPRSRSGSTRRTRIEKPTTPKPSRGGGWNRSRARTTILFWCGPPSPSCSMDSLDGGRLARSLSPGGTRRPSTGTCG